MYQLMVWIFFFICSYVLIEYLWCCICYQTGPLVYQSKTVFEDATPELVRDFFWDDEFRIKWDNMLAYCKILEECQHNGITMSHWVKKVLLIQDAFLLICLMQSLFSNFIFLYVVSILLQRPRICNWSKNMGGWKYILLCY